jgi:hypothetical protein
MADGRWSCPGCNYDDHVRPFHVNLQQDDLALEHDYDNRFGE